MTSDALGDLLSGGLAFVVGTSNGCDGTTSTTTSVDRWPTTA